jgi:hypothetical protein
VATVTFLDFDSDTSPCMGKRTLIVMYVCNMFCFNTGSDGNVDIAKASVLAGIARLLDLCANVPVEGIMYLLAGHCGADVVVFANDDPSWTHRDETYDIISARDAFDVARQERVRHRIDASIQITANMLAIVAAGNGGVHKRMLDRMLDAYSQKRARLDEILNGGTDSDDAIQSPTHQTDGEDCLEQESCDEYNSDDCGL